MREVCRKCHWVRPSYIASAECYVGGYHEWVDASLRVFGVTIPITVAEPRGMTLMSTLQIDVEATSADEAAHKFRRAFQRLLIGSERSSLF